MTDAMKGRALAPPGNGVSRKGLNRAGSPARRAALPGVRPSSTRALKVDIDGPLPRGYAERLEWTLHVLNWPVECIMYRRTRRGWHVEIHLARAVHPWRIVAAQAVLGSDYRREAFNLRRVANWRRLPDVARDRWNVLFSQKYVYPTERK